MALLLRFYCALAVSATIRRMLTKFRIVAGSPPSGMSVLKAESSEAPIKEPRCEKTGFCICGNKDADQLPGNGEADKRLCFRYTDSTIPLLRKSEI